LSYFNGGFSADVTFKVDFFTQDEGFASPTGADSVRLNDYITAANVYYRFDRPGGLWWEPTAGIRYTRSEYSGETVFFGVENGEVFRVQGGARLGVDRSWMGSKITVAVTGLLYSDVMIHGFGTEGGLRYVQLA
jgi:hypothetical protein